jgi:hypothetical protein
MVHRTTPDDDLVRALLDRLPGNEVDGGPVSPEDIASAEAQLGFRLPPLLRRIYQDINGGIGPGYRLYPLVDGQETLVTMYRTFVDWPDVPESGEPGHEQEPWPERLLPIVDWGCAMWSCLDCRTDSGPIVTSCENLPFANTGHTLNSWLTAWLEGVDLMEEMFEPGPSRPGINPFTKKPIVIKGRGKPRGTRWP